MTLWLESGVRTRIVYEAVRKSPYETGGIVLGYASESSVVVADMVGPGPDALHGRRGFVPDAEYHEEEIARRYADSGRVITYVGDWHSHPGGLGRLSRLDLRTLSRIAREPAARLPAPIMLVAYFGNPWLLAAWKWTPIRISRLVTIPHAAGLQIQSFGN